VKYEREVSRACQRRCIFNNRQSEPKGSISSLSLCCSSLARSLPCSREASENRHAGNESQTREQYYEQYYATPAKVAFQKSSRRADPSPLYRCLLLGDSGKLDALKPRRFKYTKTNERNCAHDRASVSRKGETETGASDVELMNAGFVPATGIDNRKFVSWAGILSYPTSHA